MIKYYCTKDNKIGFLSESGQVLISPQYIIRHVSFTDVCCVCKDGLFGLVNLEGKEVVPPISEKEMSIYDLQNLSIYKFKQNNSWGIYDTVSKNIIIPAIYEDIKPLTNDYVAAKLGGLYGFISREGVIISDFIYEEISYFEFGLAIIQKEHRYGLIDNNLNLKSPMIYEYMNFLNNGLILIKFKGGYGCLSKKGALVIPPKYKKIGISTKNIIELINDEGKSFIFDSNGKQYPQTLKRSYYFLYEGYRFFHFGMARAENDGKWGYIDYKGNLVINYQYEDAGEFNGDFAAIRLNGKCGIINKRNEMIVPPTFDKVFIEDYGFKVANGEYEYEDSFCLGFRGKWGLINFKGNLIYPLELDSEYDIKEIGNDIIAIQVDKKWELINITGKIISLPIFDAIGDCKGEYITVSIEKKKL